MAGAELSEGVKRPFKQVTQVDHVNAHRNNQHTLTDFTEQHASLRWAAVQAPPR